MKRILALIGFTCISLSLFAQTTDAALTAQAQTIRNETTPGANTAVRVGDMFLGIINSKVNLLDYKFTTNVSIVLPEGRSFGKYINGDTAPWSGMTVRQAILDAVTAYLNPAFSSFSITGQPTTVEVGTTLSGSKTFTWVVNAGSGIVSTIDIYDNTAAATLLSTTPNDGTQAQTITTKQLNADGATQSWKGIGQNSSPSGTFNSSNFVVTARYYRFYGPAEATPESSSDVRALPSSDFHTGASTFTLATGTTDTKFVIALPPDVTLASVIDTSALNADITSEFVLDTISVDDAGGTSRTYNMYEMTIAIPYDTSHNFSITTAN